MEDNNTNSEERAKRALLELAKYKLDKSGVTNNIKKKGEIKLKQLGLSPDMGARSAALASIIGNVGQGMMNYDLGNFSLSGKLTPEEKMLKVGYKRNF